MRSTTPTGATRHPPTERARPLSASPAGRHWALGGGWAPVEDEVAGDDVEPRERATGGGVDHDRSLWAATRSAPTHRLWRYELARRSPPRAAERAVSRGEAAADEHGGRGQPGEDDADARHAHLGPAYRRSARSRGAKLADAILSRPRQRRAGEMEAAGIEPASAIARNERLQACPPPRSRPVPVAGAVRAPGQPHSGSPTPAEALSRRTSPLIDADPGPRAQLRSTARYLITQAAKARSVSDFAVLVSRMINEANRGPRLAVRPAQQTTSKPGRPRDSLSVPRAAIAATA